MVDLLISGIRVSFVGRICGRGLRKFFRNKSPVSSIKLRGDKKFGGPVVEHGCGVQNQKCTSIQAVCPSERALSHARLLEGLVSAIMSMSTACCIRVREMGRSPNRMKKSFWGLMCSSFKRTLGIPLILVGLGLEFMLWKVAPDDSISLMVAMPMAVFCLMVMLTLASAAYESYTISRRTLLPRILLGREVSAQTEGANALCLLEPSELFSHGMIVSFYFIDSEGFEQLIGIGTVVNIQQDGKIQTRLSQAMAGHEDTVRKLAQNDAQVLKQTRVRPSVPEMLWDATVLGG